MKRLIFIKGGESITSVWDESKISGFTVNKDQMSYEEVTVGI